MNKYTVKIKALTPIWTGDADGKNTTLRETGIIGSIRWWHEALIRGLGGTACDPTSDHRCQLSGKEKTEKERISKMCPACYLFGCTGWARKLRLHILDNNENLKTNPIQKNDELIFHFIPLREIEDEEWVLLNLTLYLIAEYGAIGGKTVLKPSDENNRKNKSHHLDYGLIEVIESSLGMITKDKLEKYVKSKRWKKDIDQNDFAWVSIKNFWCVNGKYLARENNNNSSFNKVLGRKKYRANQLINNNDASKWLAGSQKMSKKVFSFKNPPRTFGFVKPDIIDFEQMKKRLEDVWGDENNWKFIQGDKILESLVKKLLEELK